jgi:ATP-dependent DNA helicase RecQ
MQPETTVESKADVAARLRRDLFGFDEYRGAQADVIAATLAGRDSVVLMPTGGGKSLCYQLPALVRDGVGLVISPLIALMHDQVRALRELGISAAFLNSSMTSAEQREVIDQLRSEQLQLLYIAPERLAQSATQAMLRELRVSVIAIDEAHCVSQWGHDFRRDYLTLNRLATLFPDTPRIALTATATPLMRDDIAAQLELNSPELFVMSPASFTVWPVRRRKVSRNGCAARVSTHCPTMPAYPPRRVRNISAGSSTTTP